MSLSLFFFVFAVDHNSELSLQNQVTQLNKKLMELDADFGAKRAKFKELFMQKEGMFVLNSSRIFARR